MPPSPNDLPAIITDYRTSGGPHSDCLADFGLAVRTSKKIEGLSPLRSAVDAIQDLPNRRLPHRGRVIQFSQQSLDNTRDMVDEAEEIAVAARVGEISGAFSMATGEILAEYDPGLMKRFVGDAGLCLIPTAERDHPVIERCGPIFPRGNSKILVIGQELPLVAVDRNGKLPLVVSSREVLNGRRKEAFERRFYGEGRGLVSSLTRMLSMQLETRTELLASPQYTMELALIGQSTIINEADLK